ncbi:PIG-L family deacetylase [Flavihumibacter rivuli]|uniref:PIG-L family deacetylase n=1 Tax=Flavihumibacter rivuli TaxID=2838156 RepID=UPI001BDE6F42|nr:PIG-L family deacetylase [Flavihumibacter rivuli]ULQ56884.1 PIG-L family deacetylase [Flavihumibacter rivuli]
MRKRLAGLLVALTTCMGVRAQSPQTYTSADILLGLQKMKVLGSVLYVAAHPDDENTRLLAYLAKERKLRTGYLSLTRGDGGQNLIGDEQGVSLGLIRTQELLAARRIDGAEQFFSRAYDFGFSKSTEEALSVWDKEKILGDVVWVIRKFRPDVIITRFPPDSRAGHGHHSASAVLANEAFRAAADPKRFPKQLKYVKPWQAKRILWNTFNFGGGMNTQSDDQYKIDVGVYNPLLGKGYGEVAAESRSQHKSQGFGVPRQRGALYEFFAHTDGEKIQSDLLDGVNTSWSRVGQKDIEAKIDRVISDYSPLQPSASVPALLELLNLVDQKVEDTYWKEQKARELREMIKACAGIYFEAVANQQVAVTGDSLQVTFNFVSRSAVPVSDVRISYADTSLTIARSAQFNQLVSTSVKQLVTDNFITDQPYWLREQMLTGSFNVNSQLMIGYAENPGNKVKLTYKLDNTTFTEEYPLRYKYTDPVKGEIYQPVFTVPPVVIGSQPGVVLNNLVPAHKQMVQLTYKSYAQRDTTSGSFRFELSNGKNLKEKRIPFELPLVKNTMQSIMLPFDSLVDGQKPEIVYPWIELPGKGKPVAYNNAMKLIQYDHIPTVHYFFPNTIKVVNEEIRVAGKKIGYIPGSGDGVGDALKQMGYTVTTLDDAALGSMDLSQFDAIITGVRAYNIKESLNNYYDKLMRYIADGGNLIVQYNTSNQIGPVKAKIGPYPFNISRTRITDEKAEVKVSNPDHPLMNFPNKIGPKDFENWIQERSIYHASGWDSHYETIFSMGDPAEKEDAGSLIMAKYGKGYFVYTGLVFFRQLPAGVPGAYRLLANIIALNQKKPF